MTKEQKELQDFEMYFMALKSQYPINANAVNAVFEAIEKKRADLANVPSIKEKTLL